MPKRSLGLEFDPNSNVSAHGKRVRIRFEIPKDPGRDAVVFLEPDDAEWLGNKLRVWADIARGNG